jgi:PAS domain S-box-containing protein
MRFSTERKVQAAFAVALGLLVAIAAAAYLGVARMQTDAERLRHTEEVLASVASLRSTVSDLDSAQLTYTNTGNPAYLEAHGQAVGGVDGTLRALRGLTADNPPQRRRVDALAALVAERVTISRELIGLFHAQGFAAVRDAPLLAEGRRVHEDIRRVATELESAERALLADRVLRADGNAAAAKAIIVGAGALALMLVALTLVVIGRDFAGRRREEATLRESQDVLEHRVEARTLELDRTSESLRASEARLSGIVASAMDGIVTVDESQHIVLMNPAAERLFGWRAADVMGGPLDRLIPARFRASHAEHIASFGRTNTTRRTMGGLGAIYGLRASGEEFPMEASISQVDLDGHKLFTVILRDVTTRMHAEEELRKQASLLDLTPAVVRDLDGHIVLWTRGAEALFGFSKDEALGRLAHELLRTEFPEPREAIEARLLAAGAWEGEIRHRTRDGAVVVVSSRRALYRDAHGRPVHILDVSTDITPGKRTEEALRRAQKLEAIGTLASGIAHDFNNILTAIVGNLGHVMATMPADDPLQQELTGIDRAVTRASDLVRRILTVGRRQEGTRVVGPLAPIVAEALDLLRASLPAMIEIRTHVPADLPPVAVDATQIHQVIMNLGTNAAHAMRSRGGVLEVIAAPVAVGANDVPVPDLSPGAYLRLSISDNGSGMDAATLARIFDPFFTTKAPGEGTGLGLATVYGIVRDHGGAVSVYSEPGVGTIFHLYLPVARTAPAAPAAPVVAAGAVRGHDRRVLFVDDEEDLVHNARRGLERLGYHVTGVTSPAIALKMFRAEPRDFDVVITDQAMPGMSGLALARELLELRPGTPIILCTGFLGTEAAETAREIGVRGPVSKPYAMQTLAQALHEIFDGEGTR